MRSLVEVCAEQRLENWREADAAREARRKSRSCARAGAGKRLQKIRREKWAAKKERALELYLTGMTQEEVAEAVGAATCTVHDWVRNAGIRGGKRQREDRVDAARLRHTLRAEGRL